MDALSFIIETYAVERAKKKIPGFSQAWAEHARKRTEEAIAKTKELKAQAMADLEQSKTERDREKLENLVKKTKYVKTKSFKPTPPKKKRTEVLKPVDREGKRADKEAPKQKQRSKVQGREPIARPVSRSTARATQRFAPFKEPKRALPLALAPAKGGELGSKTETKPAKAPSTAMTVLKKAPLALPDPVVVKPDYGPVDVDYKMVSKAAKKLRNDVKKSPVKGVVKQGTATKLPSIQQPNAKAPSSFVTPQRFKPAKDFKIKREPWKEPFGKGDFKREKLSQVNMEIDKLRKEIDKIGTDMATYKHKDPKNPAVAKQIASVHKRQAVVDSKIKSLMDTKRKLEKETRFFQKQR